MAMFRRMPSIQVSMCSNPSSGRLNTLMRHHFERGQMSPGSGQRHPRPSNECTVAEIRPEDWQVDRRHRRQTRGCASAMEAIVRVNVVAPSFANTG